MEVEVVQFRRPYGQQVKGTITLSDSVRQQYQELTGEGLRLTAEILRTGETSICIEQPDLGDYDSRITTNGKRLITAFEDMIGKFSLDKYRLWERVERQMNED